MKANTRNRRRRLLAAVSLMACLIATACTSESGATDSGDGAILRVGTTSYIDSLNPFVALQAQSYSAFTMEYPQLVQYSPGDKGPEIAPDWATKWSTSADGKTWTFHLKAGGRWSDGKPLTAADAAWTANTILKYQNGATALMAPALAHVTSVTAPGPDTLVISYSEPVGNVLAQLEQFWVLPEHVWAAHVGSKGKGLKAFRPEASLPTVAGGPYYISQYQPKGVTVFKANPHYYGTPSHAAAVSLDYYTDSTAEIADLKAGNLDFVDKVPANAASALKSTSGISVSAQAGAEVTNITFNSNPAKPRNRELLDPRVREALEYATDRNQILQTVFDGYGKPWADILSALSGPWLDPSVAPLPYDPDKANQILDSLGYTRGSDGVRVVPATTGKYAQPAHPMSYQVMVPDSLDFNGDRQFSILAADWAKVGVKLRELEGGDVTQAYGIETAGNYTKYDLATWSFNQYPDPDAQLSYLTKAQWFNFNDTGNNDPSYDAEYARQGTLVDSSARLALVQKMERQLAAARPYIQLIDEDLITASSTKWTGFDPGYSLFCACYFTSPRKTS